MNASSLPDPFVIRFHCGGEIIIGDDFVSERRTPTGDARPSHACRNDWHYRLRFMTFAF